MLETLHLPIAAALNLVEVISDASSMALSVG